MAIGELLLKSSSTRSPFFIIVRLTLVRPGAVPRESMNLGWRKVPSLSSATFFFAASPVTVRILRRPPTKKSTPLSAMTS